MFSKLSSIICCTLMLTACNADRSTSITPAERDLVEQAYSGDKKLLQKFASLGPYIELEKEEAEGCNIVKGSYQISMPPTAGKQLASDIELIAEMLAKENLLKDAPEADCNEEPTSIVYLFDSREAFDKTKWIAMCTVKKSDLDGKVTFGDELRKRQ